VHNKEWAPNIQNFQLWAEHKIFSEIVRANWNKAVNSRWRLAGINEKLKAVKGALKDELRSTDNQLLEGVRQMFELKKEIPKPGIREVTMQAGDYNTRFFHSC